MYKEAIYRMNVYNARSDEDLLREIAMRVIGEAVRDGMDPHRPKFTSLRTRVDYAWGMEAPEARKGAVVLWTSE